MDDRARRRILSAYDPTVNSAEELSETLSAVPPDDSWATYQWLEAGTKERVSFRPQHDLIQASIMELRHNQEDARKAFEKLRVELQRGGYDGRIVTYVDSAIKRLSAPSAGQKRGVEGSELADLVVGTYRGSINSDAKGSSRKDVLVTVTRVGRTKVRVTSDNQRIGTFEVDLTRIGDSLFNVGGDSTFIAYTEKNPPELALTARGEVSYGGRKTEQQATRDGAH